MSFNAFKFVRSEFLRSTAGVSVPSDIYFNNVILLARTNPEFTGTTSSVNRNFAFNDQIHDTSSPTSATLPSGTSSIGSFVLSPNSPYTTNYPSTDSVYSLATNVPITSSPLYATNYQTSTSLPYPTPSPVLQPINISPTLQSLTMSNALNIGTAIAGGFTLECWVYVPSGVISAGDTLLVGAQYSVCLRLLSNRTINVQYAPFYSFTKSYRPYDPGDGKSSPTDEAWVTQTYSAYLWDYTSSQTLNLDSWNHVAVTCNFTPQVGSNTGSVNLFINGTRVQQLPNPTVTSVSNGEITTFAGVRTAYTSGSYTPNAVHIGSPYEVTGIRFIAGNCLSVDSFTPPTSKVSSNIVGWNGSTSTFTHTACFVTHFSTNGSQVPLIDYSKYENSIVPLDGNTNQFADSVTSQLNLNNATPNLKAMYFNGTSIYPIGVVMSPIQQRINTNNNVLGLLSGQNFTVNFFFYRTASSADYLFDHGLMQIRVNTSSQVTITIGTSSTARITLAAGSANLNTWYYIQFSRTNNGSTSRTYKLTVISSSGTVYTGTDYTATTSTDASYTTTTHQLKVGGDITRTTSAIFSGYIIDYRVTGGIVRPTPTSFPAAFHALVAPT
jgi:hypothetical protein